MSSGVFIRMIKSHLFAWKVRCFCCGPGLRELQRSSFAWLGVAEQCERNGRQAGARRLHVFGGDAKEKPENVLMVEGVAGGAGRGNRS